MISTLAIALFTLAQPDFAVVICAPHGGEGKIEGVAVRNKTETPQFTTVTDTRSDKLAHAIASEITKQTKKVPFVIVAMTSRKFVDLNREPKYAYEDERAKPTYDAYHAAVSAAVSAAKKLSPNMLLLDIHGQGKSATTIFRGTQNGATLKGFVEQGRYLQQRFEAEGLNIDPPLSSANQTHENPRFNGGYTVQTYAKQGVAAIQLEFGGEFRKTENIPTTATKLARAIAEYGKKFFQTNL